MILRAAGHHPRALAGVDPPPPSQLPSTQKNSRGSGPLRTLELFLCDHLPPRPGLAGKHRPKNPEQVVTPRQLRVLSSTPQANPSWTYGAKDAGNVAENRKQEGPLPIITQDGWWPPS